MSRQPANNEVDIRQDTFPQRGFEIADGALRSGVGGDEAVLAEQGDDEGHAGNGSFLDEVVEDEGVAFCGRGVGVGDVTGLLETDDVGVDDGAQGIILAFF